jgi:hypothetical protein
MIFDQVGDDFRVGFGGELVAFFFKPALEGKIIFYDAVVYDYDASAAIAVRVGVLFGGTAMGGPARVADTECAIERFRADDFFEVSELAFGAADLQAVAIPRYGDSG